MKSQTTSNNFTLITFSFIFFGWGLLTSLNGVLIGHLKEIFQLSAFQSGLISFTFFATYFFISLIFYLISLKNDILNSLGYKYLTMLGLTIAAMGAYLIYPATAYLSFPVFMGALVVLASGITILQIAANTYIVKLGNFEMGSSRLNIVQALNSLGATLGPAVGAILILKTLNIPVDDLALLLPEQLLSFRKIQGISIQLPYWLIATSLFILAGVVFFISMPDIQENKIKPDIKLDPATHNNLLLATFGIFVYVGAEVTIGSNLGNIIDKYYPHLESQKSFLTTAYWALAMIGRFCGGLILRLVDSGKLLFIFAIFATLLLVSGIVGTGDLSLYLLVSIGLFNSIMFPGIFSSGIYKLEEATGKGASLLIMAIAGGAIIPALYSILTGIAGLKHALLVAAFCYLYIAYYGRHFQKFSLVQNKI